MYKWMAIFLLVFMPVQLSWAATGGYCQHESGLAAEHLGHHSHQHPDGDEQDGTSKASKALGNDVDCSVCHAGCLSALPMTIAIVARAESSLGKTRYWVHLTSPHLERLERPQWCGFA